MRNALLGATLVLLAGGCAQILGLSDYTADDGTGGLATTSVSAASSTSSRSATSTDTTTTTGAGSGSTGSGPGCGDGIVGVGETCDGNCPVECIDVDLCTDQEVTGDPLACTAECLFAPLAACKSWDGCCPAGCFSGNDNDCDQRVAVLQGDNASATALTNALTATGSFASVTTIALPFGTPATLYPTLADLQQYSAIVVYTFSSFDDPAAMGTLLADYVDWGGRVVLTAGANCADQYRLRGRWETDGYFLNDEGGVLPNPTSLGTIDEPASPLVAGVAAVSVDTHCDVAPTGATTVVASLADGKPLVLRGKRNGRNRVDLNFFAPSEAGNPAAVRLIANALKYPR